MQTIKNLLRFFLVFAMTSVLFFSKQSIARGVEITSLKDFEDKAQFKLRKNDGLPHLEISLKDEALTKLIKRRNEALESRILESASDDYVKGTLTIDNSKMKIKMRLKGDYVEHLKGLKWSFRVKVRGKDAALGMKSLSLQHPKMRLFLREYVVHQALKKEGLISLRYMFCHVTLNGVYLGVFNIEEHFEKRLIENNRRREGPILKFDETELFRLIKANADSGKYDIKLFLESDILAFQRGKLDSNEQQLRYFYAGKSLLNDFREGKVRVKDAFDIEKLAKYYAVSDIFMGKHGNRWHNQRFYYDPIQDRLEPVGFDFNDDKSGLDPLKRVNRGVGMFNSNWTLDEFSRMIFSDPEFFKRYISHALRIAQDAYVKDLFEDIKPKTEQWRNALLIEFKKVRDTQHILFDEKFLQGYLENAEYARTALTKDMELKVHLKQRKGETIDLVLNNRDQHLLEITGYYIDDNFISLENMQPLHTFRFHNKHVNATQNLRNISISAPEDTPLSAISIVYNTIGLTNTQRTSIVTEGKVPGAPKPYMFPKLEKPHPMHAKSNWKSFGFIKKAGNKIIIPKGSWKIDRNLILPKTFALKIEPGTTLDLTANASIIVRSNVDLRGTKNNPIIITSSDETGGGLLVFKAKLESNVEHVIFSHLSNPSYRSWQLTGAVTFFESPVKFYGSHFSDNRSEDALNTIRTEVHIDNSVFEDTYSDAFDGDFCEGKITNSTYVRSGNDSIDISGSTFFIENVAIRNAGDKGISVGEQSQAYAENITVIGGKNGFASKDNSVLQAKNSVINGATICLVTYQKKPEFGPGSISAKSVQLRNCDIPTLFEPGSKITLEGIDHQSLPRKKQQLIFEALKNGQPLN